MKHESAKACNTISLKPPCQIINIDKSKGRNKIPKRINTSSLEKTQIAKSLKGAINDKMLLFSVFDNRINENISFLRKNEHKSDFKMKEYLNKKDGKTSFNNSKEKNEKIINKIKTEKFSFNNTFNNNKSIIQTTYYTNKINNTDINRKFKTFLNDNKLIHTRQDSKISESNQNISFFNSEKPKNIPATVTKKINPKNLKQNSFTYNQSLINRVKEPFNSIPNQRNILGIFQAYIESNKINENKTECSQLSTENRLPYNLFETEPNKTLNAALRSSNQSQLSPNPYFQQLEEKFSILYNKTKSDEKELLLDNLNVIRSIFQEFILLNNQDDNKKILSFLLSGMNETYTLAQKLLSKKTISNKDESKSRLNTDIKENESISKIECDLKKSGMTEVKSNSSHRTLHNQSMESMGEHNKNITKINRNNIDDLEAIYFFDKVEMRSKSHAEPKVPRLNINLAIEKYQQLQQNRKKQEELNVKPKSPEKNSPAKERIYQTVQPVNNKLRHNKKNSLFNFTNETVLEKEIKKNRVSNFSTKVSSSTTSIVNEMNVFKKHL